ncbi:MAG: DUF2905 domain-containing protein [Candidatus Portnoybacteria bacterium]|nr:DUF2905 domain-containing protein [Candidatus Portnoybacteria bacterium]
MSHFGNALIFFGITLIFLGVIFSFGAKILYLGKLPGDIYINKGSFKFYFERSEKQGSHKIVSERIELTIL